MNSYSSWNQCQKRDIIGCFETINITIDEDRHNNSIDNYKYSKNGGFDKQSLWFWSRSYEIY